MIMKMGEGDGESVFVGKALLYGADKNKRNAKKYMHKPHGSTSHSFFPTLIQPISSCLHTDVNKNTSSEEERNREKGVWGWSARKRKWARERACERKGVGVIITHKHTNHKRIAKIVFTILLIYASVTDTRNKPLETHTLIPNIRPFAPPSSSARR